MKLGELELIPLLEGIFYLDGGAMFGVVPKTMWSKLNPADDKNRIELSMRNLLIKTGKLNILIDTGLGDKIKDKFIEIYNVRRPKSLRQRLHDLNIKPEDINIVINTHLHFDHCGGNTIYNEQQKPIPAFPKAKYFIQRQEWEDATHPNERTKASYLPENFMPVGEANQLEFVDGDSEIAPGIKLIRTGGHTRGHQMVKIETQGKTAVYWGDLIPTTSHIKIPFVMGYDLYPLDTIDKKKTFLKQAIKENWLLFFEHDPKWTMGYLKEENGDLKLEPVTP